MIEIVLILIALYLGYRFFRRDNEHFFFTKNNIMKYINTDQIIRIVKKTIRMHHLLIIMNIETISLFRRSILITWLLVCLRQ